VVILGPNGLRNAAAFYANELGILDADATVLIERKFLNGENDGFVVALPSEGAYFITLHRGETPRDIYETLAHEMVHVAQYIRGDLKDDKNTINFRGIDYPAKCSIEEELYRPWELEAYALQMGLYYKWMIKKEAGTAKN
jgi:hypothetical protein